MVTDWTPTIQNCDQYAAERTGKLEWRAIRYRRAIDAMIENGLEDGQTIFDVGAGMTEFIKILHRDYDYNVRYIPVDGGIDGTDLNHWYPPRNAHWFVALELFEHLNNWQGLLDNMKGHAKKGIVVSTPDPYTTDVLGMDHTHVTEIPKTALTMNGFKVTRETFFGGAFNKPGKEGMPDSLFGVWTR